MATVDVGAGATARSLDITPITPGTVALIDLRPGDVVGSAQVNVTTAFDGVSPSVTLGITGDLSLVLGTSDVKLKQTKRFTSPSLHVITSPTTLVVTFVASGATVGLAKLVVKITRES